MSNEIRFELSERLNMVADLVPYAGVLADIGCDHAYLAMDLVRCGMVKRAVCSDVNRGPLARAEENIRRAGLGGQISTRLSDGLDGFAPGEADAIVLAGMGGRLMLDILSRGREAARSAKAVVLQPQSDMEAVRRALFENGWRFLEESVCREGDKYYFAIKAAYENCEAPPDSRAQIIRERYGPLLWQRRDPLLKDYVLREWERKGRLLLDERIRGERRMQLEEELYTDGIALQHLGEG